METVDEILNHGLRQLLEATLCRACLIRAEKTYSFNMRELIDDQLFVRVNPLIVNVLLTISKQEE